MCGRIAQASVFEACHGCPDAVSWRRWRVATSWCPPDPTPIHLHCTPSNQSDPQLTCTHAPNHVTTGASAAVVTRHHALGGAGAVDLAQAVVEACKGEVDFQFLYDVGLPIKVRVC